MYLRCMLAENSPRRMLVLSTFQGHNLILCTFDLRPRPHWEYGILLYLLLVACCKCFKVYRKDNNKCINLYQLLSGICLCNVYKAQLVYIVARCYRHSLYIVPQQLGQQTN